jgi:hypothetical protein
VAIRYFNFEAGLVGIKAHRTLGPLLKTPSLILGLVNSLFVVTTFLAVVLGMMAWLDRAWIGK